jgi:hypothetical protein
MAESAEVVEDVFESVVSDRARDTGSSSRARFIPAPMDDLLVLIICWIVVCVSMLYLAFFLF